MNSRREFLKKGGMLAFVGATFKFSTSNLFAASDITSGLVKNGEVVTASHFGVLKLTIKDGKIVKSAPYKKESDIRNTLQEHIGDLVTNSRIKHAYVRKSYLENPDSPKPELRGAEEFVKVKYEDAIKLVAKELKKTKMSKGANSVFAGSYGWKSTGNVHNSRILLHRFMNMTGGFTGSLGDYSTGAAQVIMPHVVGGIEVYEQQTAWPVVIENSKVVVWWGANPVATLKLSWTGDDGLAFKYLEELKKSGKEIIIIDPCESATTKYFDKAKHIKPIPNTDVAMMLGMANHLYKTGKYDKEFLANYTYGFDKFLPYLLGKEDKIEKTPEWASKICGIDAKTIKELAEKLYNNRSMIMAGWGMQRAHHGEQPHWMIVTLCAMIGQIGLPGGGFGFSYHYSGGGVPTCKGAIVGGISAGELGLYNGKGEFLGLKSDNNADAKGGAAWLRNSTDSAFPVARIADALLNPGKTIDHNGKKIKYPEIDFIYWVGGNPLCHHQQTNENVKAWRKPRTVVVNSIYWTPTARMADIVFGVTSEYERNDITMVGDYSNCAIAPQKQAVEKQYEAKDDYQIFSDLCLAYGGEKLHQAYTEGKDEFGWIKEFYNKAYQSVKATPDLVTDMKEFDEFWKENKPVYFASTPESEAYVKFADFREDPILEALGTPSGLIEIYSDTIEKMGYDDCKAHPTWFEPIEWLGMKDKPAEFHLVSAHPEHRLHSQQNQTSLREEYAVAGHEPIFINEADAKKKDIKNGDVVRVFNARGEILCGAVIVKDMCEGVVKVQEGAWYDPADASKPSICKNGSANVLTLDIPTSKLANGNISHTCLVNIEKYKGENLKVSVFDEPKISDKA